MSTASRHTYTLTHTHTHSVLTAIFPGETGLAGCPLILLVGLLASESRLKGVTPLRLLGIRSG